MLATAVSNLLPRAARGPTDNFWYRGVGNESSAGVEVTTDTALAVSSVYACSQLLCDTIGSLPARIYQKTGNQKRGRKLADDYWLDTLLYEHPTRWHTPFDWFSAMMNHVIFGGNFYAEILQSNGERELMPFADPRRMTVKPDDTGYLRYAYKNAGGTTDYYSQFNIFHVRGLSMGGPAGVPVIDYARNSIGLASAQETHGAALFKNGGLPPVWIKRPATAPPWDKGATKDNFRKSWRKIVGGAENAGNPPILEDGMELMTLGINNEQLQWIEAQGFSGAQICRFFRVLPWMIGLEPPPRDTEQGMMQFIKLTLRSWCYRIESAIDMQLVDNDDYYSKFDVDTIQKASLIDRAEAANVRIQGGWWTRNEARADDDLDPLPGLDEPLEALNMQPAGSSADWNEQGGQPGKGKPVRRPPKQQEADEGDAGDGGGDAQAALADAFRPLLRDAADRIANAEIGGLKTRAAKADKDRAKWKAWLRDFYGTHAEYVHKTVGPLNTAWKAATGQEPDWKTGLAAALSHGSAHLIDGDAPAILSDWETTRGDTHYRTLLSGFGIAEKEPTDVS